MKERLFLVYNRLDNTLLGAVRCALARDAERIGSAKYKCAYVWVEEVE